MGNGWSFNVDMCLLALKMLVAKLKIFHIDEIRNFNMLTARHDRHVSSINQTSKQLTWP